MKACDKKLRDSILRVMNEEDAAIEEEMKQSEPHVFSESFEKKMEELMKVQSHKHKRSYIIRYVAATAAVVLFISGIMFVGHEDLRASDFSVSIREWMENFFVIENDTNRDKDENVDVLFEESQIGYLPEGFEKVFESVLFSKVQYKYENDIGYYIIIQIYRDKALAGVDNEEITQEVGLNSTGLEYRYIYKEDSEEHIITWVDEDNIFYSLSGSLDKEELIKVMNNISY